ncbi:hypothetical protein BLNAU_19505 [Blattamonas nauphoetae]|uniref:Uncharacterized protein n=1 Tax=Blattamonas nauphoetae TaxID=2049346 RepID=A0ABQ9X196_9EUKA|nr:hypothetical protein BLNAU_19505 [Blattamonas nauphoetae]
MFTNEQPISDDEIVPIFSAFFQAVCVSERPIPFVPRTSCELNKQPTIEIERDAPQSGNAGVSTRPRNWSLSFEIEHLFTTINDEVVDPSNIDGEIRIALVIDETSTALSDTVSTLPETMASLAVCASFLCFLDCSELAAREKWSDFNDSVELLNENMQFSPVCLGSFSSFALLTDPDCGITCVSGDDL